MDRICIVLFSVAIGCGGSGADPGGTLDHGGPPPADAPGSPEAGAAQDGASSEDAGVPESGASDAGTTSTKCASGAMCDGKTGTCTEPRVCGPSGPCLDGGVVNGAHVASITTPIAYPSCQQGDALRKWSDAVNGQPRAACVFTPVGASAASTRPLVIYLHGSGSSAASVYTVTSLRAKAATYDLTGDPKRPGFHLVADQGRNEEAAPNGGGAGQGHDWYYRDLSTNTTGSDLRNIDRLIDELALTGAIDTKRIYIIGYSNGAFSGMLYTLARYATPTPGGNFIAASAIYGGSSPLAEPQAGLVDCRYNPLPTAAVSMLMVQRACDWEPCDATQRATMGRPPGYSLADWLVTLRTQIGAHDATSILLDDTGHVAGACDNGATCTIARGQTNHGHWPNGVHDGSGIDYEPTMLDYLKAHPHP
jgi:predicted esterase